MLLMLALFFAACVLTVLFWAAVVATAAAILSILWLVVQAGWWLITRPIVWLIIRPVEYMCGVRLPRENEEKSVARVQAGALLPISSPAVRSAMTTKVAQLGKLKSLLEDGAINQDEFDRMKSEVLAS